MRRGMLVRDGARGLMLGAYRLASGLGAGAQVTTAAAAPSAHLPVVDPTIPANRKVEPVVLTGADLPGWAVPSNTTAKAPFTDLADCQPGSNTDSCQHNRYVTPEVDTSAGQNQLPAKGIPTDRPDTAGLARGSSRFPSRSTRSSPATCRTTRRGLPSTPAPTSTPRTSSIARASATRRAIPTTPASPWPTRRSPRRRSRV